MVSKEERIRDEGAERNDRLGLNRCACGWIDVYVHIGRPVDFPRQCMSVACQRSCDKGMTIHADRLSI